MYTDPESIDNMKFLRHLFTIPFLTSNLVVPKYFIDVVMAAAPKFERFTSLIDYLIDT